MATPLSVFRAAERFITANAVMDPGSKDVLAIAQATHVIQVIGGMQFGSEEATSLTEVLAGVDSPFTHAQRCSIATAVRGIIQGYASTASAVSRTTVREQTHLFGYNYMSGQMWPIIRSVTELMTNKQRHVAQWYVQILGCRNPSAQTKRSIVAMLHAATGATPSAQQAYDDLQELSLVFKQKRDSYHGCQTLKVFPEAVSEFMARYPSAFPENDPPITCPIDIDRKSVV